MALQIAKDIGSLLVTIVAGQLDAIILDMRLASSQKLVTLLRARIDFLTKVAVIPGSFEMEALALGVLRVLRQKEEAHRFQQTLP